MKKEFKCQSASAFIKGFIWVMCPSVCLCVCARACVRVCGCVEEMERDMMIGDGAQKRTGRCLWDLHQSHALCVRVCV